MKNNELFNYNVNVNVIAIKEVNQTMCEFLSAVKAKDKKGNDKWYHLTHHLIHETPRGEIIQKKYQGDDELIGHSAIREYFELQSGEGSNWECTDFSTPDNFPPEIVEAIKRGDFRGFGEPKGLLSAPAWKAYEEAIDTAYKAYRKTTAPAEKACREAKDTAEKACREAKAPTWKAYEEAKARFWDLFAIPENRAKAWR